LTVRSEIPRRFAPRNDTFVGRLSSYKNHFSNKLKMSSQRLKRHRRYYLYRIYPFVALIVWLTIGLWGFPPSTTPAYTPNYLHETTSSFVIFLTFLPAPFMLGNLMVFPFEFSMFGPYERTLFADEVPIVRQSWSFGRISWFSGRAPVFTWIVYPSGIGIAVFGIGKVFVPVECIVDLRPNSRGYILRHNSPELRNPVTIPAREVFEAVQVIISR
jgi:hypothetical protein